MERTISASRSPVGEEATVTGIMEFCAAVFPHGFPKLSKIGERRNHPCTGLWIFVVMDRNLVWILEQVPPETQLLLDQQLCVS